MQIFDYTNQGDALAFFFFNLDMMPRRDRKNFVISR
jgi:hypothetical protein